MIRFKYTLSLLLFLLLGEDGGAQTAELRRVLFVGNSLTYTNNLPLLVKEVAMKYDRSIETDMLAFPNFTLEDHWLEGKLQKLIASGRFDILVVQQGPSSQADGREMLLGYGLKLKKLCQQSNVALAFFMVWPPRNHAERFKGVIKNYSDAAEKTGSILCPVGLAWKTCIETNKDCDYYDADGFHPSLAGSKVAAAVIYKSLFQ
jgi:hypothetical protein